MNDWIQKNRAKNLRLTPTSISCLFLGGEEIGNKRTVSLISIHFPESLDERSGKRQVHGREQGSKAETKMQLHKVSHIQGPSCVYAKNKK